LAWFLAFHRHETHRGPLCCFANGFGICFIILLPLYERLYILGRIQANGVTKLADLTSPVMRAAARFHRDNAHRLAGKKFQHPVPSQSLTQEHYARGICPMRLKYVVISIADASSSRGG
jgi:hypothetical protein